jgi:molybdopterin molybdotransferase
MITEIEALERILSRQVPGQIVKIPVRDALGRFLARDVFASIPNPRFHASSMDGYAVRVDEAGVGSVLKVSGEQPAGLDRALILERGCAIRIFTGAPIPAGADAVIMQEDVSLMNEGGKKQILCNDSVQIGENIRRAGADLCVGQRILNRGQRLTPARLGLLASQGLYEVETYADVAVAVLTTGDELASAGARLEPGQIYDSNGMLLAALLSEMGIQKVSCFHCGDSLTETLSVLTDLAQRFDVILIAGGVSVGDHDQVKPALAAMGLSPDLWRVKVKPGKPFLFAQRDQPAPLRVFGLPGNPVSAFVTFHVFVRPALLKQMGAGDADLAPPESLAVMESDVSNPGDRPHYLRGRIANGKFSPSGLQQSHAILGLSQSNALFRMEPDSECKTGETVQVILV